MELVGVVSQDMSAALETEEDELVVPEYVASTATHIRSTVPIEPVLSVLNPLPVLSPLFLVPSGACVLWALGHSTQVCCWKVVRFSKTCETKIQAGCKSC